MIKVFHISYFKTVIRYVDYMDILGTNEKTHSNGTYHKPWHRGLAVIPNLGNFNDSG